MTEADERAEKRVVQVSQEALSQIYPEIGGASEPSLARSWFGRRYSSARISIRLLWTRVRFYYGDFQQLRCRWATLRLRMRLLWMRLRHRGHLPP